MYWRDSEASERRLMVNDALINLSGRVIMLEQHKATIAINGVMDIFLNIRDDKK
jgi:hypothetical protein